MEKTHLYSQCSHLFYEAPRLEVLTIYPERGFAESPSGLSDFGYGGSFGDNWN